jgi:Xaa-Pro aminopeptidase
VSGRFTGPQRDLYEVVLDAQLQAIAAARNGRLWREMHDVAVRVLSEGLVDLGFFGDDADAEEVIVEERFKRFYMHGTGHWLGMDVHDAGMYYQGFSSRKLEPGMVLTVEPGLYVPADDPEAPEAFRGIGIRIEDDVLVTRGAPDVLTKACPKSVRDVEAACGG